MKWAKVISGQLITLSGVALVAVLIGGYHAGISALLAGMCCVIPNIVMFAGLHFNDQVLKKSGFATLFVLELVKLALSVVLLITTLWFYEQVSWLSFLVSFVITLKSYIFLLSRIES